MAERFSLRDAERKTFRAAYGDGLLDILLGCFVSLLALAPVLSEPLGDFWSSMVFLPFWGLVYLALAQIRKRIVAPRVGVVRFGRARRTRLQRLSITLLVINALALILGLVAAWRIMSVPGPVLSILFGMILLVGLSIAACLLDLNRLYVYALLAGLSPLVGEWLWSRGLATHHGFPITFGFSAAVMLAVGLVTLVRLVRDNPVPDQDTPSEVE